MLASLAPAWTLLVATAAASKCTNLIVPITVSAVSYTPTFPPFENHYQSVGFLTNITSRNVVESPSPIGGYLPVTESFNISVEYCAPSNASDTTDVQVLSHGLGFGKEYWSWGGAESQYSYVRAATAAGFATLSYDRIGNGLSSNPDPYTIQQGPIELAILAALTGKLRNGTIDSCVPKPKRKVYHIGHSFGSFLTNGLAAAYPTLSDGIVLTGYSTNLTWQTELLISMGFHLARENQPARFGDRSTGSVVPGDELAIQFIFFTYPYFDPAVAVAANAGKYPFSIGEILTTAILPQNATSFTGPVLVITGDADTIFCGADCYGILEQSAPFFPAAKPFQTYVQPHMGHGMNLHYNASGFYGVVTKFLEDASS
ncbi:hypothetical protein LTR36_000814 [Oleoguttula mirabilis]|uniref:AB hydrolase-1 domain-containing protein n=1 Tax=Oleoguttula mirabilis TaxID=1507867 RepID=A0AAV9J3X2_9PEZI|nr:hypothetical protein LTR36_000814 [Oleoguttula mirabilis]